eukprot:9270915-Pyramimonas_sp.AAC.1
MWREGRAKSPPIRMPRRGRAETSWQAHVDVIQCLAMYLAPVLVADWRQFWHSQRASVDPRRQGG